MAGHFHVFRRYQKAALAGLAIMAMLAFFVLPPLLQMGGDAVGPNDGVVVRWNGGSLKESDLERVGRVRRALNQFLMALRMAAMGDQRMQAPLRDDEKGVVDTILMAREAEANGIVVSDVVVNDFLGLWTGDRVTPEEMQGVIADLRSRAGVTESDLFDALRDVILGERLQALFLRGAGFMSTPPGWRWEAFRKLEQSATVEVVPVVVESLASEVPAPSTAALEKLYTQYASDLPRARSTTPGFREPARATYDALVARADLFVAESEAAVTDDEISKFYEENKETMFQKVAEPPAGEKATTDEAAPSKDVAPPAESTDEKSSGEAKPVEAKTEEAASPATKATEPASQPAEPGTADKKDGAAIARRSVVRMVAFQKEDAEPAADAQPASALESATTPKDAVESAQPSETPAKAASEKPAEETPAEPAAKPAEGEASKKPVEFQPLDKVKDDIRKQLGRQAADKKISEIFGEVTAKIAKYSDDLELALGLGEKVPVAPDVQKIAAEYGLEGVRSEFVTASEAAASEGVGRSFQFAPSERFGFVQQRWADLVLTPAAPRFRPVTTRDIAGAQYLSWKTEDRPEFTPPFAEIKSEVERVWKLLESRPLAKKRAEEIASAAKDQSLADAIKGREGLAAASVGPFTWLTRGTAPFGSGPVLSDPDGVEMAGEAFMQAVFSLEPGQTTVVFNEPKTVCYAIRLVSYEPDDAALQGRFREATTDPRRLASLAEGETREVYERWLADIERKSGVTWVRSPRQ
jgi:hypothetical protein